MIDISTGGTKYTEPYEAVIYALDKGVSINNITFSSDGNAGIGITDESGKLIGFKKAPVDLNYKQIQLLVQNGGLNLEEALKIITLNPAINLGLKTKGKIEQGYDADFCFLDDNLNISDVIANGNIMIQEYKIIKKGNFELH